MTGLAGEPDHITWWLLSEALHAPLAFLGPAAQAFLAATFLLAALSKVGGLQGFQGTLERLGLPSRLTRLAAFTVIGAELGAAGGLAYALGFTLPSIALVLAVPAREGRMPPEPTWLLDKLDALQPTVRRAAMLALAGAAATLAVTAIPGLG